ncbi:cytidylyltransferase domain-containing protein [Salinibacter ruber]|uniref:cytidylyltransferase domain-containing protein n=1 Tax=Salinibacter ruber TaxID=146919 RepID=UPI002342CCDA
MIDGHSLLGSILARDGSKELPRKNIRDLAAKPLIGWTIHSRTRLRVPRPTQALQR